MRTILFLLAASLMAGLANAQNQVVAAPIITPPYSVYLSDYQGSLVVNLTNTTNATLEVKLIGSLTGDNGYSGHTKSSYSPAVPITLGAMETKVIQANSQALAFIDPNNFQISAPQQIENAVMQTGILPEGNYEFCVQAVDFNSNAPLSAEAPIGCLFFTISYAQPPVLTFPWCDGTVDTQWPVFTWSPPVGNFNMANVRYDLYILELLPGQNPTDALWLAIDGVAGNPMVRNNLMAPSYPWQPYDPSLKTNTTYAVGVVARDVTNNILFENKGRSEVCTFVIQPPAPAPAPAPVATSSSGFTITPANLLPIGPIKDTHVKGRLVYRFKDSGRPGCSAGTGAMAVQFGQASDMTIASGMQGSIGGTSTGGAQMEVASIGNMVVGAFNYPGGTSASYSVQDQGGPMMAGAAAVDIFPKDKWVDRFPVSTSGGTPMKNIPIKLVERVVLEGVVSRDSKGKVTGQADRVVLGADPIPGGGFGGIGEGNNWHSGQIVATGTTGPNGQFDFFYHQPSFTGLPVAGSIDYFIPFDKYGQPAHQLSGSTTASRAYKVLMIEVASPYYCSPDLEIYAEPGDDVELPDQACYVRSYDLKVTVTQGACDFQMGGTGAPMGNVQVSVLRPKDHAPGTIPENEGQHLEGSIPMPGLGEVPLVSQCATKTGDGSALFHNMVFHDAYTPDKYLLKCSTDDDRGLYTYHDWSQPCPKNQTNAPIVDANNGYLRNSGFEVPEYDVPVALVPRSPRVIGRVMVSVTQPLADALVTLHLRYDKAPGQVPPMIVGCDQSTSTADFTDLVFKRTTDANGFFDFSNILVKASQDGMFFLGPHASISVTRPGYWPAARPLPSGSGEQGFQPGQFNNSDPLHPMVDLKMGLQWDMTSGILMKPFGLVKGTIQDENGKPVRCDVQVGNGPWGRSEAVVLPGAPAGNSGGQWAPSGPMQLPGGTSGGGTQATGPWMIQLPTGTTGAGNSGQYTQQAHVEPVIGNSGGINPNLTYQPFSVIEQFKLPAPPGDQVIQLFPLSDQYFPLTVTRFVPFNIGTEPSDLGVFTVKEKRHRLRVELNSFAGPVVGATVRLDERQQISDQDGVAYFEFLSPETEFRLKVDPPGDLMPVDSIIVNPVSPEPVTLELGVENGTHLLGRVEAGPEHTPVSGARVWVETGADQYGPQMNQTTTDGDGEFILQGVPMGPFTVHAAKADSLISYIGTSRNVTYAMVPGPPPSFKMIPQLPHVVLALQRVEDMDLTSIYGFPVEVTVRVQNSDGSSAISGAFVNLPGNGNFRLEDPAQRILFTQVKVEPGPPNAHGVPRAVPVNGTVVTDMTQVPLKLYTGLDATLKGMPFFFYPGRVQVQGTPGGGTVRGTVSSELSTFNFSYEFTGRFYLGDGPEQPLLDVFRSNTPYPQRTFNLMTLTHGAMLAAWKPDNAKFSLRGFQARSDREHSFVEPDVFRIATVVQVTDVPDLTPHMLELNVGDIRVTATTIEGIQGGGDKLSFKLNNWTFTSTTPWTFSNDLAAIVIAKGTLDMQLVKADMTQIMIRPNALEMNAQNLGEVRLGGVAPLVPEPGVPWTFGYDPGYVYQGKTGAWRFGTMTAGNGTVATIQGPPELVPNTVQFSSFSMVSRGQPLAEVRALNYRYFNIMDLVPVGSMQFTPDGVDLLVNCSMAIHGLPQTTGFFSFFKDAGKAVSRLKPLGTTITTGRGNVYFKMDDRMASQVIKPGEFTCYGRFRIDPENGASGDPVYAYGFLDHKVGNTYIDVIRTDADHYKGTVRQAIRFGGAPDKKMLLNSGRQTMGAAQWNELAFKGNLVGMDGIADGPENELSFTVKGAVDLDQGKLSMSQLATPFGDMNMSYDFQHARLVGSMDLSNNNFGAVNIVSAQLGLLVDKNGFLVSCYDSHVIVPPAPWPLQDHHPAFMIGAHNAIPDTLLTNLMAGFRLKSLPSNMAGHKISGMYLQDKLSLVDFSVPSINLLLLGVSGHASCAVEGRNWVDLSGGIGLGGMAYADAGLEFWLLSPIPNCSTVSVSAGAEMLFEASFQNEIFTMTACGSANAAASICGVGDSFGLTVKGSVNSQGKITLKRISGSCGQ